MYNIEEISKLSKDLSFKFFPNSRTAQYALHDSAVDS